MGSPKPQVGPLTWGEQQLDQAIHHGAAAVRTSAQPCVCLSLRLLKGNHVNLDGTAQTERERWEVAGKAHSADGTRGLGLAA